jgi:general secretion pathway protein G
MMRCFHRRFRLGWSSFGARPRRVRSDQVRGGQAGLTLVELIVTVAILGILASAAVPIARFKVKRDKERELRYDLW